VVSGVPELTPVGVARRVIMPSPAPNFSSTGACMSVRRLMPDSPWRARPTTPTDSMGVRPSCISDSSSSAERGRAGCGTPPGVCMGAAAAHSDGAGAACAEAA
jgi:hypothetical protein